MAEGRKDRIFIVDDDPNIVDMLKKILNDEGYEADGTTQSLRAFDHTLTFDPDLVIMDLMMPYMDGLDQIKLLSLDDKVMNVSVMVITAKARALDDIDNLRALRIFDYLYKPFDVQVFLEKVARILRDHRKPSE